MNIALLMPEIGDVSGGGGAERFFADFFQDYRYSNRGYKMFFITDHSSIIQFQKIGKFEDKTNVLVFKNQSNRFKSILEFFHLLFFILTKRIKVILLPLFNVHMLPVLKNIDRLPFFMRPRIVPIIVDYNIAFNYFNDNNDLYNYKQTYGRLFNEIKLDGIITWYASFKKFAEENNIIKSGCPILTVTVRYSPSVMDLPEKRQRALVFAGRLTPTKQPLFFLEAINATSTELKAGGWKVLILGRGSLEQEVKSYIHAHHLEELVDLTWHRNPKDLMKHTMCYVSTQDHENFPSLAMNEAMLTGNAIIARNVGQTNLFVHHLKNGILLESDDVKGLSDAILYYISLPEQTRTFMSNESIRLTRDVHTFENFSQQFEANINTIV